MIKTNQLSSQNRGEIANEADITRGKEFWKTKK